jgi:8-amino-7-oxononanoate synthase
VKHSAPPALTFLAGALRDLEDADLLRRRAPTRKDDGRDQGSVFCSNDYLGWAADTALDPPGRVPFGAGASRLISGEREEHAALEAALSAWLETEAALVFSSGYAANVGVLSSLVRPGDLLLSDALNHASLIDGARLSRAEIVVYPHLDVDAVERGLALASGRRAWVVTESYFSMDADSPDLGALRRACDASGAGLIVDEAHALGVLGPDGRGVCARQAVVPDVLVGTLGKAFGAAGAFAVGCSDLALWLWNRARSFVFSTGISPFVAEVARDRVERSRRDGARRERALARAAELRSGMRRLGIEPRGYGAIVPWVVGDSRVALRVAEEMRRLGVLVQAIRPPTVPEGTSRLRLTTSASHTSADVERALGAIRKSWDPKQELSS